MITVTYSKRGVIARALLFFLLFSLFAWLSWGLTGRALDTLPDGDLYTDSPVGLSFDALSSAAAKQEDLFVSGQAAVTSYVFNTVDQSRYEKVHLVFTDGSYPDLHGIWMEEGTFFSTDTFGLNRTDIVISTELAFRLYGTLNGIVGRTTMIGDREMVVVGVYSPNESLMGLLSTDGVDTVYAPYYSAAAPSSLSVADIYVREKTGAEAVDTTLEAQLNDDLNGQLDYYQRTQNHVEKALLRQRLDFTLFFSGWLVVFYLAVFLVQLVIKDIRLWRGARDRYESIRGTDILKKCIAPAVLVVCITAVIRLVSFPLYLPFKLTPNNILDPRFYLDYAVEQAQLYHSGGPTFYGNYAALTAWGQRVCGVLALAFLFLFLRWLYRVARRIFL